MSDQVNLTYLLAHLEVVSVSFQRPLLLGLLLLIPLLFYFTPRRAAPITYALRAATLTLLILALAGLRLSARLPQNRLSLIAAVDMSDSIDQRGREWAERYLNSLAASLPPDDELGVVEFAGDSAVLQAPAPAEQMRWKVLPLQTGSTNLAAAIDSALALSPPDSERRIVLITDGNETRDSCMSKVAAAKLSNTTIFAAVPPRASGPDTAVEKVAVPLVVTEGSVFLVRVVVNNDGTRRTASLALTANDESLGNESIELQPGLNAIDIPYQLRGAGSRRIRAHITAEGDTIEGNNYREATVTVSGKPSVLLVTSRRNSSLAMALERKGFDARIISPADLPTTVEDLLGYHAVVFDGVTAKSFGGRAFDALETYVRDFGGAFVMAGGSSSFGDADFKKTALERLLPVTLEPRKPPKREREPLALFMLIDRSKSMGYHFRNRFEFNEEQSKLVYAKRAALSVVRQLRDSDQIGVIAFDSLPFELASLRPVRDNRVVLERDIPRVRVGGGTDFFDALQSALRQLVAARSTNAHVILMTDGNTNRPPGEHDGLIAALVRANISVTTIRIGEDQEDLSLLKAIAKRTGGSFYEVANAEALPQLLLKDATQQAMQTPQGEPSFVPRVDDPSQILQGIGPGTIPVLSGYALARPRPGADIVLHVDGGDKKDPLLASWQYGLGHVVAFTADLQDDAEAWLAWDGFGKLWSQIVRWAAPPHTANDYAVETRRDSDGVELNIETFADLGNAVLSARLVRAAQSIDVPLVPTEPRRFRAKLRGIEGGYYTLAISTRLANGEVRQRAQSIRIASDNDPSQEEFDHLQPNLGLLQRLTTATGGAVDAPVRTVTGRKLGTRRVDHPLDWWLLPLAMLLFLAEIAYRRFR